MSADRLAEIKARCDAATEGPWEAKEGFTSDPMIEVYGQTVFINPDLDGDPIQPEVWADVEFISAAREDVPWLLTLVESLTAERDALAAQVTRVESLAAGHRCEPYYSRSQCGQCGWQEQWCATCSRQMCGCATETTDQEDQS